MATTKLSRDFFPKKAPLKMDFVSKIVDENCRSVVNFYSVRSTLPKVVFDAHSLVKVTNRLTGDFYAITEVGIKQLLDEAINNKPTAHSFFDGMETFPSGESIGLSALDAIETQATEYSVNDLKALQKLAK